MDLYEGMPEPVAKAWERGLTSGRAAMSRRRLLRAASLAAGGTALAACGIPPAAGSKGGDGPGDTPDHSREEKVLNFANWPLYIDVDPKNKKKRPTLDRFERESGVKVKYVEDVNDNNEFYGKIKPQLAAGQDTGRDLVCLSDWMAGRMIRQGWAQRLDPARLPHAVTNLEDRFRAAAHDPGRQFSYPWAGTACIVAYNKKATKGKKVTSVTQLLEDESLKGRVSMLTEMTDTIGLTMLDMGVNSERFDEDDFNAAIARIQKAVDRKQLRRFSGNDYMDELDSGDIAACVAWAGDIVQLQLDNPDVEFAVPERGYLFGTDDLLVPAKARHQSNAEALIDFYYRPKEAAELAAWVNYICPVSGAKAEMEKIDKELADDKLLFPDARMISKGKNFRPMSAKEEAAYEEKFAKLIGA
ncbi:MULTISPECIES: spermidine/putrescine ABC transporter substrate-binding protein [unclassified Streptomyces]|uniref:polyamine ABC transporter substrate-binding protein n=1 Tax=unclassified Streptomyces TaxID=2593676 RepID=UPI002DD8B2CF|nr:MULTISPECIES: spermidine/putrescine ABC transporter substrate-binding protein [unclassified Streptomyces]WSB76440.1 spermidine/putrescine ABC transporter substrate-binding protein [Streptomyces sp. NBC_01775]WSS15284.1 spermidine/putrescine ABC transporter substrate-binding protein [Streptomyces sp. NBC_01186]WSS44127.1 spermidine/putrescine ABC transporter substrate-binding protein [Streptomyces sp. NBC_01187]